MPSLRMPRTSPGVWSVARFIRISYIPVRDPHSLVSHWRTSPECRLPQGCRRSMRDVPNSPGRGQSSPQARRSGASDAAREDPLLGSSINASSHSWSLRDRHSPGSILSWRGSCRPRSSSPPVSRRTPWVPSRGSVGLRRVSLEGIHLGRTETTRVDLDVILPFEVEDAEGGIEEV